ncbi:hypothetical protein [Corallococcus sp. EGB]|uniref:hypothetical protein n=1 Tax=Corallococcus sp. EGB TaxID=1521117 RepID=UPI001CBAE881|nr:hypothetical protein [Corallococcus sp. EGB]
MLFPIITGATGLALGLGYMALRQSQTPGRVLVVHHEPEPQPMRPATTPAEVIVFKKDAPTQQAPRGIAVGEPTAPPSKPMAVGELTEPTPEPDASAVLSVLRAPGGIKPRAPRIAQGTLEPVTGEETPPVRQLPAPGSSARTTTTDPIYQQWATY